MSQKISKEKMIEEIKEELITYFKNGIIQPSYFFSINDYKFNDIYKILKIHFLLLKKVQEFILKLESEIRNIKNSTVLQKKLHKGKVRGRIDWNETINYRASTLYMDKSKFICHNIDKLFNTKENIVLKKTIEILYNIIFIEIKMEDFQKRDWYSNGEKIAKIISNIYLKNVYMKKINTDYIKITDKIVSDVSKSRIKIYRDAAKILKLYRDLMNLDEEILNRVLSETYIKMVDENKVFELYCIFKFIRNYFPREKVKYEIMDGRESYIAKVVDEKSIYEIYHDSVPNKYITFNILKDEIEHVNNEYLKRKLMIFNEKAKIYSEVEKQPLQQNIWGGRPDLLILEISKEDKNLEKILIGEIKYTNNKDYMYKGLEELLEYIHFVKDRNNNSYIRNNINDVPIEGILFVDNIELDKYKFENIKIINRDLL